MELDAVVCKDGFRCEASYVCIPKGEVCDGRYQCPFKDDELLCKFICPYGCTCIGFVVNCRSVYANITDIFMYAKLVRVLDLSNNNGKHVFDFNIVSTLPFLYHLNMSKCHINGFAKTPFKNAMNLLILDLSRNKFEKIEKSTFTGLRKLKTILLDFNEHLHAIAPLSFQDLINIRELRITGANLKTLEQDTFAGLTLRLLDLSNSGIETIQDNAFNGLKTDEIHLRGDDIQYFGKGIFSGVSEVRRLITPAYKFCCFRPKVLGESDCLPHGDAFSSCQDLLKSRSQQVLLWLIGSIALLGNMASLIYRISVDRQRLTLGYGIFVTNLAVSDFLMGMYLIIIAIADVVYRDR